MCCKAQRLAMGIHECTRIFLDNVPEGVVELIPILVLQTCFINAELFQDLTTLNRTACVNNVTNFQQGITYACTYYYLSTQGNTTNCRQFYHVHANYFDVMPCYTVGENIAQLFAVTTAPLEVTFFVGTLIVTVFWLFFQNSSLAEKLYC